MDRSQLRQMIITYFSLEDFKDLCFELGTYGVSYDALPGDEKQRLKEAKPVPRPAASAPAISATAPRRLPPKAVAIAPPSGKPKLAER